MKAYRQLVVSWVHKASIQTAICGKWWGVEKCLKADDKITDQDMITADQDPQAELIEKDPRQLNFTYLPTKKGYFYNPKYNT